ncbi:uncharacterized protein LOC113215062 [Frankliniella occidentalis]|uniref:Uncharacterized protein LOC113215062 n=1 Tax=Frankliniella occidentalis TaxID=133901 RepID=A0A9C6X8H7_FRAOC|nr:uncharacterized protein LOC113215062 [Frankliniella occidentalis]
MSEKRSAPIDGHIGEPRDMKRKKVVSEDTEPRPSAPPLLADAPSQAALEAQEVAAVAQILPVAEEEELQEPPPRALCESLMSIWQAINRYEDFKSCSDLIPGKLYEISYIYKSVHEKFGLKAYGEVHETPLSKTTIQLPDRFQKLTDEFICAVNDCAKRGFPPSICCLGKDKKALNVELRFAHLIL